MQAALQCGVTASELRSMLEELEAPGEINPWAWDPLGSPRSPGGSPGTRPGGTPPGAAQQPGRQPSGRAQAAQPGDWGLMCSCIGQQDCVGTRKVAWRGALRQAMHPLT